MNWTAARGRAVYLEKTEGKYYSGAALMYGGFTLPILKGDYPAVQYYFVKEGSE